MIWIDHEYLKSCIARERTRSEKAVDRSGYRFSEQITCQGFTVSRRPQVALGEIDNSKE